MNRYSVDPEMQDIAFEKSLEQAPISANLLTWSTVHGALSLALRHPEFGPRARILTEEFLDSVGAMLVEQGFWTDEILKEHRRREAEFHATQLRRIGARNSEG